MAKQKYPPLILELIERRPSAFIMKGTEKSENPDRLDTSSEYMIRNTSVVVVDGVRKKTRYISGIETIFVEEQEKAKILPNPAMDIIFFTFGRLTVEREGLNIGLYDFLAVYDGNRNVPRDTEENKKIPGPKRPVAAVDLFYQINTEANAETKLAGLDDFALAITTINALRVRKPGVKEAYDYKTEEIEYICKLLGVQAPDSPAEKLEVLLSVATKNPVFFNNLLKEASGDLRVEIVRARELGVISMDGADASWIEGGKSFYKFKEKKDHNKRIAELVAFFGSPAAEMDLAMLKTRLEFAGKKEVETV